MVLLFLSLTFVEGCLGGVLGLVQSLVDLLLVLEDEWSDEVGVDEDGAVP